MPTKKPAIVTDPIEAAKAAAADGNPHLVTTSTWATLAEKAWKNPASAPIDFANFHVYVRATGWIGPKDQLANDSARFFSEYSQATHQDTHSVLVDYDIFMSVPKLDAQDMQTVQKVYKSEMLDFG